MSDLENRISVEQFGIYKGFEHEPTEEEVEQTAQRLFADLLPHIKDRIVIQKHWPATASGAEYWTVSLKLTLPSKSPLQQDDTEG